MTIVWFLVAFFVGTFFGVFVVGLAQAAGERDPKAVHDEGAEQRRSRAQPAEDFSF